MGTNAVPDYFAFTRLYPDCATGERTFDCTTAREEHECCVHRYCEVFGVSTCRVGTGRRPVVTGRVVSCRHIPRRDVAVGSTSRQRRANTFPGMFGSVVSIEGAQSWLSNLTRDQSSACARAIKAHGASTPSELKV